MGGWVPCEAYACTVGPPRLPRHRRRYEGLVGGRTGGVARADGANPCTSAVLSPSFRKGQAFAAGTLPALARAISVSSQAIKARGLALVFHWQIPRLCLGETRLVVRADSSVHALHILLL